MIYIGMIYQYYSSNAAGLIMLSDGEKKEFTDQEWVDTQHQPALGQKISYEINGDTIRIKVATQEDITRAESEKENIDTETKEQTQESSHNFSSVDEAVEHYTGMGFKLVKDIQESGTRTVALRSYVMGDFAEVTIKESGSKFDIEQTLNGKSVPIS